jgi:tetraacyldisaccharide 4'-kinase
VPVVVALDRTLGAAFAVRHGADVLVLDDGFQHRRLHRDADVVLWDLAAEGGRLLPRGRLREPREGLRRAHLLVLVDRGDGAPPPPPEVPAERVFRARLATVAKQRIEEGLAVHVLSGIADPESFERALVRLGLRVTGATRFADHHPFTAREVAQAAARAVGEGADCLAVTAKDWARWPGGSRDLPVPAVFDVEVEVDDPGSFVERIMSLLEGHRA